MPNLFDSLQARTFRTAGRFFGYDLVWIPSDASETKEARVLFKDPAESADFFKEQINYHPINPVIEYYKGDLPGLYELMEDRHRETVTINVSGVDVEYEVLDVRPVHDGQTYKADLQLKGA